MSVQKLKPPKDKPLSRLQDYLVELEASITLIRKVLIEVKELIVVVALIAFFVWGVIQLFKHLHG